MILPVFAVVLDRVDDYRRALQGHAGPLMSFIACRPTGSRKVEVTHDTTELYRYFDYTDRAEFLYGCAAGAIECYLTDEIEFPYRHDEAKRRIMDLAEMPDRLARDLIMFIRQNTGKLPKRRRKWEFSLLTDREVVQIEAICEGVSAVADAFVPATRCPAGARRGHVRLRPGTPRE